MSNHPNRSKREIRVPFAGFYESIWSLLLDVECEEQRYNPLASAGHDLPLDVYSDALMAAMDYRAAELALAQDYVKFMESELSLGLKFASLDSPREYNFETDRIFATIPKRGIDALWRLSRENDQHANFKRLVAERFTSRSGFVSFYNPDFTTWGPRADWDHNQLGVLLEAVLPEDWELDAESHLTESAWQYIDSGADWVRYESAIQSAALEVWHGLTEEECNTAWNRIDAESRAVLPEPGASVGVARCTRTIDMFKE